jgi:hypothetical protein
MFLVQRLPNARYLTSDFNAYLNDREPLDFIVSVQAVIIITNALCNTQ